MKHVLIYGPQACGKTRNKDRLAAAFNCQNIVDDGQPLKEIRTLAGTLDARTLFLTYEVPSRALSEIFDVLPFDQAMRRAGFDV